MDEQAKTENDEIDLLDLLRVLWSRKLFIVVLTALSIVGSFSAAMVWPKTYVATSTALLVTAGSSGSSQLSQLAGLASLAGVNIPTSSSAGPGKSIQALLKSRMLAVRVVQALDLGPVLAKNTETVEEQEIVAAETFMKMLKTKEDGATGVLSLSIEYSDPVLARDMANKTAQVLEKLLSDRREVTNRKNEVALQKQIGDQAVIVGQLQADLAQFQRSTSLLDPKSQATSAMEAYSGLIQQKMALEVQLAMVSDSLSDSNTKLLALKRQISSLEDQIVQVKNQVGGDLPSLKQAPENFIKYQNITRDLEIATRIYATLLGSREQTRLSRAQEETFVDILDPALLPTVGKPARSIIVLAGSAGGFFLAIFGAFVLEWVGSLRARFSQTRATPLFAQTVAEAKDL